MAAAAVPGPSPALCSARHRLSCRRPPCPPPRAGLLDALFSRAQQQPALTAPRLEDDPEGAELLAWAQQRGLPQQKLASAQLPASGRGLVAAERIAAGELLLRVPAQLVITADAATQQSAIAQALADAALPAWTVLALWLVEARAAGAGHPWAPYLAILPERPDSVLEWPAAHVEWLRGSHLHAIALGIRSAAERSCAELGAALAAAEAAGLPAGAQELATRKQELDWAFGVLLSRLVRLDGLGGAEALVPWADLLNHDCTAATHLDWDAAAAAVVLQAVRGYRPGEEVCISYGQKTSGQLLLSYGFAPNSNPHDACLLELSACGGSSSRDSSSGGGGSSGGTCGESGQWLAAAAAAHGYAGGRAVFPLRMEAVPEEMIRFAAFAAAEVSSAGEAERLAAAAFGGGSLPPDMRAAGLELVVTRCREALEGYSSSMEADAAELEKLEAGSSRGEDEAGRERRRQVLRLLIAERRVLHRAVFLLQQELRAARRNRK